MPGIRPCSSVDKSGGLLSLAARVRILPGVPPGHGRATMRLTGSQPGGPRPDRPCSSVVQSNGFLNRASRVRVPPGLPRDMSRARCAVQYCARRSKHQAKSSHLLMTSEGGFMGPEKGSPPEGLTTACEPASKPGGPHGLGGSTPSPSASRRSTSWKCTGFVTRR